MKTYTLITIWMGCILCQGINAQGIGLGYNFNMGWQNYTETGVDYSQERFSVMHEGFFRIHDATGLNSVQFGMGFRSDYIPFTNTSQFLDYDGITINRYQTDAVLHRKAWRLSISDNLQFGVKPGNKLIVLSGGLYMEHTLDIYRTGPEGEYGYTLKDEIRPLITGVMFRAEVRLHWLTFGYKYDKSFSDIIDHDYINSLRLRTDNSSELRGLRLGTSMSMLYVGIALDFFHD